MDEAAKNRFKWKFYRLAVQLNAIVLLFALSIVVYLLVRIPYRIPAVISMLILGFFAEIPFNKSVA